MNAISNRCPACFTELAADGSCPQCGADAQHTAQYKAQQLPPGTLLNGHYQVGNILGQGGFGITYLCFDLESGQRTAIKEYFPADHVERQGLEMAVRSETDQDGVIRGLETFFDEVKVLMEFNQHPNIIQIIDYFFENQTAYFVMPYLSGKSLRSVLNDQGGRLSYPETATILFPIMRVLEEVHLAGLLHRDIAPDNLLILENGSPVLMDFGSARMAVSSGTLGNSLTLKPGYAPIEQYGSLTHQGPWTDIYSLGAVFYRCLTGAIPADSLLRSRHDTLRSPFQMGAALPEQADWAIMKALAVDPQDRFQTVQELRAAFEPESGRNRQPEDVPAPSDNRITPEPKPPVDISEPPAAPAPFPFAAIAAAAAILALLILLFFLFLGR